MTRRRAGAWYREVGQGMGPALNTAAAQDAYVLTDRGTWLAFRNRQALGVLVEGDQRLFNQYGVMAVNPERHPHVKAAERERFMEWLVSPGRAGGDRLLPHRGRAVVLPECRRPGGVMSVCARPGPPPRQGAVP